MDRFVLTGNVSKKRDYLLISIKIRFYREAQKRFKQQRVAKLEKKKDKGSIL